MLSKLKYACIGAGGIADKKHLSEYSKTNLVEISAICDTNIVAADNLAKKYGVSQIFTDHDEMFDKIPLDFVSICTPNFLHAPITMSAIKRGIHVHCEKPLVLNAKEAQEIIDMKNRYHVNVMVAMNHRFTKEAIFIKKCIQEGLLGEIYHAKCGWRRRNGIPGKGVWFTDKALSGGGALIDLGVHFLDLALYFMGFPKVASVLGSTYSKFGNSDNRLRQGYKNSGSGIYNVEDMAVGFVQFENEASLDFEFSWASNIEKETKYLELLGTKGGISLINGELKVFTEISGTSVNIEPDFNSNSPISNEFKHFVDSIHNKTAPLATAEEALQLMRLIDTLYESSNLKKQIPLFDLINMENTKEPCMAL